MPVSSTKSSSKLSSLSPASSSSSSTSGLNEAVSPPITECSTVSTEFTKSGFMVTEKISSSGSSKVNFLVMSTSGFAARCGRVMRVKRCCCLARVNSGTYSNTMLEFSSPYHFTGEPHMRRIMYFASTTTRLIPEMFVSGERTLRKRQNLKSPTLLSSR